MSAPVLSLGALLFALVGSFAPAGRRRTLGVLLVALGFGITLVPQLSSGEVMGFWQADTTRTALNVSPVSLPFKLNGLGWVDWGWGEAKWLDRHSPWR